MPTTKITKGILRDFLSLVKSGHTQVKAADQLGQKVDSLRIAAERLGEPWPQRFGLKERVLANIDYFRSTKKTQAQWAAELGVSQVRICRLFHELGLHHSFTRKVRTADYHRKTKEFHKILAYIQDNGGYVKHAIEALGLITSPQEFRRFTEEIGIDLSHYQFAWQEYREWLTVPGPWEKKPPCNYIVPAVCRGCGGYFQLNLQNARTGKTHSCVSCANETRNNLKVLNVQTGETYRSIRSWAKQIGRQEEYQKLRIQIREQGEVTLDDARFVLCS